jgi:serine/threonine protein kinase
VVDDFRFVVITILGASVSSMRRMLPDHHYTQYTVLRLALEMLKCIEALHSFGYLHRDIKPGNFLLRPHPTHPLCLIDFGLSHSYLIRGKHIDRASVGFIGTCRYASLHAHDEKQLSRRDDLISWFYSVIELAKGQLPWPGGSDRERTIKLKRTVSIGTLCDGLPREFAPIWIYLNRIDFKKEPDYCLIKRWVRMAIQRVPQGERKWDWDDLAADLVERISPIALAWPPEAETEVDELEEPGGCVGCAVF